MEHTHEHAYHPPISLYYKIFGALMILTAITVAVAFQDFGVFNNVIALAIAGIKTTLVVLFFMHVKYESKLTKLFAAAGFIWLAILLAFTLQDTETRRHDPGPKGWAPLPKDIVRSAPAHGSSHTSGHAAPAGEHAAPSAAAPAAPASETHH
jgi:cytochrome c oxidase subunit 4